MEKPSTRRPLLSADGEGLSDRWRGLFAREGIRVVAGGAQDRKAWRGSQRDRRARLCLHATDHDEVERLFRAGRPRNRQRQTWSSKRQLAGARGAVSRLGPAMWPRRCVSAFGGFLGATAGS